MVSVTPLRVPLMQALQEQDIEPCEQRTVGALDDYAVFPACSATLTRCQGSAHWELTPILRRFARGCILGLLSNGRFSLQNHRSLSAVIKERPIRAWSNDPAMQVSRCLTPPLLTGQGRLGSSRRIHAAWPLSAHPRCAVLLVHPRRLSTRQHGRFPWLAPVCTSSLPANLNSHLPMPARRSRDSRANGAERQDFHGNLSSLKSSELPTDVIRAIMSNGSQQISWQSSHERPIEGLWSCGANETQLELRDI